MSSERSARRRRCGWLGLSYLTRCRARTRACRPERPSFCHERHPYLELSMGKFGWSVVTIVIGAVAADQYLNNGYYTDGAMAMLRQIRNSFGW
jgi:hypothetical protein